MEKQNDNGTNNKIDVNQAKPPKKRKTSTIIIIVLVVFLLFSCVADMGGSDSSSSSTASSTTTEDKSSGEKEEETVEPEDEEEVEEADAIEDAQTDNTNGEEGDPGDIGWDDSDYVYNPFSYDPATDDTYKWIGDTLHLQSQDNPDAGTVNVTITNCGILTNPLDESVVYVDIEIENNSTANLTFYGSDMTAYVDDYQITSSSYTMIDLNDATYGTVDVSAGRKAKTTLRAQLPSDYYKADKVDVDLFDTGNVVIIKDEGYNVYGRRNVLDLLAEELAAQEEKRAQEEAFQAELDRLNSISIDESLLGDHAGIDNPNMTITLGSSYGLYYNAELYIDDTPNNYISAYVRMEEDSDRAGYLTFDYPDSEDESENKCGTIYFGMDGIRIELDDYPEYNGVYW